MKRIHSITLIIAAFSLSIMTLCGCSVSTKTPEQKAAEEQRIEAGVMNALQSRRFRIKVDTMIPRRGATQRLSTPYSITVDGDKFISYLPYFGVAYDVPYGGGKALNFESKTDTYTRSSTRKGEERIVITTNNGEDVLNYDIKVFPNGKASIEVWARKRESISFWGELDPDDQPEFKD